MNAAPGNQLREDIDLVGHLAVRARVFLDIWWIYEGAPTRGKYLEAMNRFSEFYRFDPHAHFVAMVMYLSQLFESRSDTLNLPFLIQKASSEGITVAVIDQARSVLEAARPLVSKLMILRSNLFAHRSAKLSYAEVFDLAEITADQLRDLSGSSLRVVNLLGRAVGVGEKLVHALSPAHAEAVLQALASSWKTE